MNINGYVVDNPKTENEKNTQKRQFYDFALENVFHFRGGNI